MEFEDCMHDQEEVKTEVDDPLINDEDPLLDKPDLILSAVSRVETALFAELASIKLLLTDSAANMEIQFLEELVEIKTLLNEQRCDQRSINHTVDIISNTVEQMMGVLEKLLDSAPEGPLASTHLEITGNRAGYGLQKRKSLADSLLKQPKQKIVRLIEMGCQPKLAAPPVNPGVKSYPGLQTQREQGSQIQTLQTYEYDKSGPKQPKSTNTGLTPAAPSDTVESIKPNPSVTQTEEYLVPPSMENTNDTGQSIDIKTEETSVGDNEILQLSTSGRNTLMLDPLGSDDELLKDIKCYDKSIRVTKKGFAQLVDIDALSTPSGRDKYIVHVGACEPASIADTSFAGEPIGSHAGIEQPIRSQDSLDFVEQPFGSQGAFESVEEPIRAQGAFESVEEPIRAQGAFDSVEQPIGAQVAFESVEEPIRAQEHLESVEQPTRNLPVSLSPASLNQQIKSSPLDQSSVKQTPVVSLGGFKQPIRYIRIQTPASTVIPSQNTVAPLGSSLTNENTGLKLLGNESLLQEGRENVNKEAGPQTNTSAILDTGNLVVSSNQYLKGVRYVKLKAPAKKSATRGLPHYRQPGVKFDDTHPLGLLSPKLRALGSKYIKLDEENHPLCYLSPAARALGAKNDPPPLSTSNYNHNSDGQMHLAQRKSTLTETETSFNHPSEIAKTKLVSSCDITSTESTIEDNSPSSGPTFQRLANTMEATQTVSSVDDDGVDPLETSISSQQQRVLPNYNSNSITDDDPSEKIHLASSTSTNQLLRILPKPASQSASSSSCANENAKRQNSSAEFQQHMYHKPVKGSQSSKSPRLFKKALKKPRTCKICHLLINLTTHNCIRRGVYVCKNLMIT